MNDPVRAGMFAHYGVDDPSSAREIPAPRLRFTLASEANPLDEAVHRAQTLASQLVSPLRVRWVLWASAEVVGLPPLPEPVWSAAPTADGVPRRIASFSCANDDPVLCRLLSLTLRGELEADLWVLDAEGRLLRPYDDRGADVVAPSADALDTFALRYAEWLLEDLR